MSSPSSTLKKKSPVASPSSGRSGRSSSSSFRHPDFSDDQIQNLTQVTQSLFRLNTDDAASGENRWNIDESGCPAPIEKDDGGRVRQIRSKSEGSRSSTSEENLMRDALKRLYQYEQQLAKTQQALVVCKHQLRNKEIEIAILRNKIQAMKKNRTSVSGIGLHLGKLSEERTNLDNVDHPHEVSPSQGYNSGSDIGDLDSHTDESKHQKFSKKSSMDTIGITGADELGIWESNSPSPGLVVDYDALVQNIMELNIMAGEEAPIVSYPEKGTAIIKIPEALTLTLYANGIMVNTGPFRDFCDGKTQQFLTDIMDGFFPSEIQHIYPEGVPFKILDKRNTTYQPQLCRKTFEGKGRKLASNTEIIPDLFTSSKQKNAFNASKQQSSQIVYIVKKQNETEGEMDAEKTLNELKTLEDGNISQGDQQWRKVLHLRIKSETGNEVYFVTMSTQQTVQDLRGILDELRPNASSRYDIISSYPYGIMGNDLSNLHEYGITHDRVLYLRSKVLSSLN